MTQKNNTKISKYLFLDFDGVLNTGYYQDLLRYEGKPCLDSYGALFDPDAVAQLKRIIDATGADIIIESSWKYLGLDETQKMWEARQMPGHVIDITPSYISDDWLLHADLSEIDPAAGQCKGMEIASWLTDNAEQNAHFAIIDDEYVILDSQLPNFILTDSHDGITMEDADRAIAILNSF